jgi:DnaJ-class molecular chaperone
MSFFEYLSSDLYRGYYEVMGLQPGASKQELQAAYRGLALKHHPDRVPEAQKAQASKMFLAVQQAYSVLRDPGKRRDYDLSGR